VSANGKNQEKDKSAPGHRKGRGKTLMGLRALGGIGPPLTATAKETGYFRKEGAKKGRSRDQKVLVPRRNIVLVEGGFRDPQSSLTGESREKEGGGSANGKKKKFF